MIILRMQACFGVLDNRTLELQRGLNVLYAPNESGKSTWCAFIRAMLYGIDTSQREKQGIKPEKIRYAPWNGTPMSGSMDLLWNDRAITLRRSTDNPARPMQKFSAVFTGTETPVPELTAENVGRTLTGVTRDVFERTALVQQGSLNVKDSPELEMRLRSLVTTGEETVSYEETDKLLRRWSRRYTGRGGMEEECDSELADIANRLSRIREARDTASALEAEIAQTEDARAEALHIMERERAAHRKQTLEDIAAAKKQMTDLEKEKATAKAHLTRLESEAAVYPFRGIAPAEAAAQTQEDILRLDFFMRRSTIKSPLPYAVCMFVLAALYAAVCFLYPATTNIAVFFSAGAAPYGILVPVCIGGLFLRLHFRRRKIRLEAQETTERILTSYRAENSEGLPAALENYTELYHAVEQSRTKLDKIRLRAEDTHNRQQELYEQLIHGLDFSHGDSPAALAGQELQRLDTLLQQQREQLMRAQTKAETAGDACTLESRREELIARKEKITKRAQALTLAIETLSAADTSLNQRMSPLLNARSTEYFARLTGNRYDAITLDRSFAAITTRCGEITGRESTFLSAGTADQLYISVRLAMCSLALSDSNPCPFILDDALVNFDGERLHDALTLLNELGTERQILLFTCRKTE